MLFSFTAVAEGLGAAGVGPPSAAATARPIGSSFETSAAARKPQSGRMISTLHVRELLRHHDAHTSNGGSEAHLVALHQHFNAAPGGHRWITGRFTHTKTHRHTRDRSVTAHKRERQRLTATNLQLSASVMIARRAANTAFGGFSSSRDNDSVTSSCTTQRKWRSAGQSHRREKTVSRKRTNDRVSAQSHLGRHGLDTHQLLLPELKQTFLHGIPHEVRGDVCPLQETAGLGKREGKQSHKQLEGTATALTSIRVSVHFATNWRSSLSRGIEADHVVSAT